ncbi:hypothetical protein Hamer_G021464 [Homarus americanus]|uniref:Uncharacterized protein n=1 Tax=Homarus americanus TaxID=6706 RepID=A0A8J5JGF4_HOMAM|nr:hypothetical protein Hamer_G021464 [Homarus americanus]
MDERPLGIRSCITDGDG